MKLTRNVLTTAALAGVMLAGTAVPAQAAMEPPTGSSFRTCKYRPTPAGMAVPASVVTPSGWSFRTCKYRPMPAPQKVRPHQWRMVRQG